MNTTWKEIDKSEQTFEVLIEKQKKLNGKEQELILIFGSNSQLRALAEVYACDDSEDKFIKDFVGHGLKL